MMNENKWRINYAVLRFIEENTDVLSNSVIFGDRPSAKEVYGFSCFNENEGIISVRNSSGKAKTFTVVLDEKIGKVSRFNKTEYGVNIEKAVVLYNKGLFSEAKTIWER